MRLHELSITAFGPFVDTVRVDFDELATGGLFLLTGDTGAGKTSVLDAVCFALYGEVPGERHTARHLRSDHAAPDAEPLVVLRFSVGERTFRFTRSPAWDRPRRRGTGSRRIQAHVVAEELRDGEWTALTNRLDEAGHLVSGLLGMTCAQFTQVAMLPQGRFQAFLQASSSERHAVLQRLFRTRRFEDVERWLVDRRIELRRRSQTRHDECAGVLNRFQEAAGVGVPEEWDLLALDAVADDGSLAAWAERITAASARAGAESEARLDELTAELVGRQHELEHAQAQVEARARGERARHALAALAETQDDADALARSLDLHRRAAPVVPLARRTQTARAALADADADAADHRAHVALLLGLDEAPGIDVLGHAAREAGEARAVAASLLAREQELEDQRARVKHLSTQVSRLTTLVDDTTRDQRAREADRGPLAAALVSTRELASRRATDRAAVQEAWAGLEAARELEGLTHRLADAHAAVAAATERAHELRESYLDLREQRISGMAAELAVGLAVGGSCPVCGSAEHPSPAVGSGHVSRADEDAARERHESAAFELQARQEAEATLRAQLTGARARSQDLTSDHWQRAHDVASRTLEQSTAAQSEVSLLDDQLQRLDAQARAGAETLAGARVQLAELTTRRSAAEQRCSQLTTELDAVLRSHEDTSTVAQLVDHLTRSQHILESAHAALVALDRARAEADGAQASAVQAAGEAGFASVADALAAVLPPDEVSSGAAQLDARSAARAGAQATLAEEPVTLALTRPAPDLPAARSRVEQAAAERDSALAAHRQLESRGQRLAALGGELDRALEGWAPLRREHLLVSSLAALVEGKSADNLLKMRLSAYVLSERLLQVVAAANERLGAMTDERYTLAQADERGAGEQRGGLSLRVRDEWTASERDPATLSGGETFLVSLALALGLADTVSHEAGGTQLDTLFIDEGFGTLDATTLDGVMDTLDSLRDGGRVVGLVSHVAELRNRVTSQLEVRKTRQGSTVQLTH